MRIRSTPCEQRLVELGLAEVDAVAARGAVGDGLGDGVGLLVDLLEHERLVAALLGGRLVPVDARDLPLDRRAVGRDELHAAGGQDDDLLVLDELHVARVREEGRDRGAEELLAVAAADDERALLARADERARLVGGHRDERVVTLELGVGGADGLDEAAERHVVGDEVRDDLGVGLRREVRAAVAEAAPQRDVVLDDAVDDDVDAVARVEVRVGVGLRDAAVGRPARVADPARRLDRRDGAAGRRGCRGDGLAQPAEVADGAHRGDLPVDEHGDAGGVIAAVLELLQAGEEDLLHRSPADVSDDAAHRRQVRRWPGAAGSARPRPGRPRRPRPAVRRPARSPPASGPRP